MKNAIICFLFLVLSISLYSQVVAGFQEYYIPGQEDDLLAIFNYINADGDSNMHTFVSVTATTDNTEIIWDHWENGYSDAGDQTVYLSEGGYHVFESSSIPTPVSGTNYDGGDRVFVIGGPVFVARASYPVSPGEMKGACWELFPVDAWENSFTIPFGVDQFPTHGDFEFVSLIAMSGTDGNIVTFKDKNDVQIWSGTLNRGQQHYETAINAGSYVTATHPVQIQMMVGGNPDYQVRGYSGVPTSNWSNDYYVPITSNSGGGNVDVYLYNPNATPIIINWEHASGNGTIEVPANSLQSFYEGTEPNSYLPTSSGLHVYTSSATDKFWGVASVDTDGGTWDWGFDLIPIEYIRDDYRVGWAPINANIGGSDTVCNAVFIQAMQDDTDIWVDYDNDGTADKFFTGSNTVDEFEVVKVADTSDNDTSGAHIWATGNIAIVYGEIPGDNSYLGATTPTGAPALDLGYTILPMPEEWVDPVIKITAADDQGVAPVVAAGEPVTFTMTLETFNYGLENVDLASDLDVCWEYELGTSLITHYIAAGDNWSTTIDPTIVGSSDPGYHLVWDVNRNITAGDYIVLTFDAHPTACSLEGENEIQTETTGTYNSNSFTATDNEFVTIDGEPGEFGDEPVPVTLSSFTAAISQGSQLLEWTTQSEDNSLGWHVYRNSEDNLEGAVRITESLIEGAGFSSQPIDYTLYDDDDLNVGETYWYFLENLEYNNSSNIVGRTSITIEENDPLPVSRDKFIGNYPNPFNPSTSIVFSVKESATVKLIIYNMKGQKVIQLLNENRDNGTYSQTWNGKDSQGSNVGSGLYLAKLTIGDKVMSRKMLLMK